MYPSGGMLLIGEAVHVGVAVGDVGPPLSFAVDLKQL